MSPCSLLPVNMCERQKKAQALRSMPFMWETQTLAPGFWLGPAAPIADILGVRQEI